MLCPTLVDRNSERQQAVAFFRFSWPDWLAGRRYCLLPEVAQLRLRARPSLVLALPLPSFPLRQLAGAVQARQVMSCPPSLDWQAP